MHFNFILATILILNVATNARVIDTEEIISTENVTKIHVVTKPIEKPITTVIGRCLLGQGEVSYQKSECNRRNGRFFKKFYDFPACYSDFVCLLPGPEIYVPEIETSTITEVETPIIDDIDLSNCITLSGIKYCSADISNISSCQLDSDSYDFKKCISDASERLSDLNNLVKKPSIPIITEKPLTIATPINTIPVITSIIGKITPTPIPITAVPKPIEECALGKGVVMNQLIDCEKQHGRFYKKFHPYPECYSDYVCFLPPTNITKETVCIYIDGKQYCQADITNVASCRNGTSNYDLLKCAKESQKIFSDLKYKDTPPLPTPFRPITMTTTLPVAKTTTTATTTIKNVEVTNILIPATTMPVQKSECFLGKGDVTNQLIDCEKLNGRFFKKFHPYPECYSDYVCFLPAEKENPESSTCVYIDKKQYCQADITNIDMCKPENTKNDVVPCAKRSKEILDDFSFEYNIFIPKPYTPISMSTTLPVVKTTTEDIPTKTPDVDDKNKMEECPVDEIDIKSLSIECQKQYGKFYELFHPYPDCYTDYVCFLPPITLTKDSVCIYINERQYCRSDITNIDSCRMGTANYDLLVCAKESKKIFKDLKYKDTPPLPTPFRPITITKTSIKPILTLNPITKPIIEPTVMPITKITTTTTITTNVVKTTTAISSSVPIPEPTIKPMTQGRCLLGEGDTMLQYIDCTQLNGKFYSKGHGYPDCYADFICFIPKLDSADIDLSNCINIDDQTYCSVEVTNVKYCNKKKNNYDFKKCVEEASGIFEKFSFQPAISIVLPDVETKKEESQSTTIVVPEIPSTIVVVPTITKNFVSSETIVNVDVEFDEIETDSSSDEE